MNNNIELAKSILDEVGGPNNIANAYHCMTRLRLSLQDQGKLHVDKLKNIPGVLGVVESESELQIVIGPAVDELYTEFIILAGLEEKPAVDVNLDEGLTARKKHGIKAVFDGILSTIAAAMNPLVPMFVVIGMANVVAAVIGPSVLNLVRDSDPLYTNFYNVGQAIVYFLPVLVAVTTARHFKANIYIAVVASLLPLFPDFMTALSAENGYVVFGIPAPNASYNGQFLHVLLVVWAQSHIEKFLAKYVPKSLNVLLVPFGTVILLLPLTFCVFGPIGVVFGEWLSKGIMALYDFAGPVETMLWCAAVPFTMALGGIGRPIFFAALTVMMSNGVEYAVMPISMVLINFVVMGCCVGYIIKTKSAEKRSYAITYLTANAIGGVTEPAIFGMILPDRKTYLPVAAGGAVSGLYIGLMKVGYYSFGASNVLSVLGFVNPNGGSNFVHGCIGAALGFIVTFVLMLVFYKDEKII